MVSFLFVLLFIIGIILIILDVRDIVKWRQDKKRKINKLDPELANNVLKALAETDIKPVKDNLNKSVDDFADLIFKEDNKDND